MPRTRARTAALVTAGALALGGGVTAVSLASADPSTSPSTSPSAGASTTAPDNAGKEGHGGRGDHGRGGGFADTETVSQLATKLGVSEDTVRTALQEAREELKPSGTPSSDPSADPSTGTKPDPTARDAALAKALASKLGIDEAKVTAALAEIRSAREADRTAAFAKKIAQAVTDGTLTQAEADAVLKAQKLGLVGGR